MLTNRFSYSKCLCVSSQSFDFRAKFDQKLHTKKRENNEAKKLICGSEKMKKKVVISCPKSVSNVSIIHKEDKDQLKINIKDSSTVSLHTFAEILKLFLVVLSALTFNFPLDYNLSLCP